MDLTLHPIHPHDISAVYGAGCLVRQQRPAEELPEEGRVLQADENVKNHSLEGVALLVGQVCSACSRILLDNEKL